MLLGIRQNKCKTFYNLRESEHSFRAFEQMISVDTEAFKIDAFSEFQM